jgi:hypothetical protein
MGFLVPSALPPAEAQTCPGLPRPVHALSGFYTLLALFSAAGFQPSFMLVTPMGFPALQSFALHQAQTPFRGLLPSCRYLPYKEQTDFKAFAGHKVRPVAALLQQTTDGALLGFTSSGCIPVDADFFKRKIRSWASMPTIPCLAAHRSPASCHANE